MAQAQDFMQSTKVVVRHRDAGSLDATQTGDLAIEQDAPLRIVTEQAAGADTYRKLIGLRPGERKLFQASIDWLVAIGGFVVVALNSARAYDPLSVAFSVTLLTGLWFFFASAFSTYSANSMENGFRSAYNATQLFIITFVVYTLAAAITGGFLPVARLRLREDALLLALLIPLILLRVLFAKVLSGSALRRHVVVVGANRSGREMVEALKKYGGSTFEFAGYFDDSPSPEFLETENAPVHHSFELLSTHNQRRIDQIILANPTKTQSLLRAISICHERGIQITPMFALYQDLTGRVPVSHVGQDWYVALPGHVKATTNTYMAVKRAFDIILAFGVLACVAPILPLIALAIRLDSPGPIFFKQVRTGRGGRQFKIVKFRSMKQDAEALVGAVWAKKGDPRITRVGRFMRKSRLDELPQLWNVLVGDMSFVGPRPERPEFEEKLEREVPFYRARRAVQPGLTGWAQVCHGYGNTMFDALRKVEYDLYYIKNESLYLDALILLRTVAVVLKLGGM